MTTKLFLGLMLFLSSTFLSISQNLPSPKEHFGFSIGDDYKLADYTQTEAYFKKIASASNRVSLVNMGLTEEGRSQYMMIISSPENIKNLTRYKEISQKLAHAEGISDEEARKMSVEGKAVVWIDGGLHATETVGTHQLIETIWQLVSRNDPETLRILDDVIILMVHANPDGQELVSDWYMRNPDTLKRSYSQLPRLYQKYVGHDNNRDFYMMNMKETQNISKQLYIEWMPQIIYNHHQSGPAGSVVAGPPYRDPFNYLFNPLVITGIDAVGAAMINRLNLEGKPGYTERGGSQFSTWYNGGLRTTAYFHNMIGVLTEIIGNPTPMTIPFVPLRLIPSGNTPYPVKPQKWLYKKSIDYSLSLNYAVLDYAARNREHLLYNIYSMGKSSIEAGNRDNWTISPKRINAINDAYERDQKNKRIADTPNNSSRANQGTLPLKYYSILFSDSTKRDPRGYVIPAVQPDFPTAVKFINVMIQAGISVSKAVADFNIEGNSFPAGSYIIKTNQAFRPHILDMFEPQDYPNDFLYPGGPPVAPYDMAGWTPAYTMGFKFKRILNAFDGPFQSIPYGKTQSPRGNFDLSSKVAGYILDSRCNNSFVAVNDLIHSGLEVYRLKDKPDGTTGLGQGSFFIPAGPKAKTILDKAATDLSLNVKSVSKRPVNLTGSMSPLRIALWDMYGGSISSGWMRWIFEQNHFSFKTIYAKEINAGNLRKKYDVIIFVSGAIPPLSQTGQGPSRDTTRLKDIPAEYQAQWGRISADTSIASLKSFMESGGSVITIGNSTNLAYHLKLSVTNALVEMKNGKLVQLTSDKYYIPGSVMHVIVDSAQPAAWGMEAEADVLFDSSPVFRLTPEAQSSGKIKPLAWFGSAQTLRSGWAWGQEYLQDGVAAFEASVGSGRLYAFGPEITFRAQTYSTFKLIFNQLYSGY
ncbi:MAG: M14 family metallopeptidase [Bacteroidia bacterium]|nr:M14 family metallopeptidase [Bacteroidia bacterium]